MQKVGTLLIHLFYLFCILTQVYRSKPNFKNYL